MIMKWGKNKFYKQIKYEDKDGIKVYSSGYKLLLKVNSTTKILDSNYYYDTEGSCLW